MQAPTGGTTAVLGKGRGALGLAVLIGALAPLSASLGDGSGSEATLLDDHDRAFRRSVERGVGTPAACRGRTRSSA